MKTVMGIINLQEDNSLIRDLTSRRAVESIPFAGRYRLIDFTLSSMVNSSISCVGIMLPDKPRSVLDHLRSGKDWDLARRHDGLFYLPAPQQEDMNRKGDLKNFYHNLDFFEHSSQRYVLLTSGSFVYNVDFSQLLRFHQNTNADITVIYNTASEEAHGKNVVIETAENGLVTDIAEKPAVYDGTQVSTNVYLMEKRIFVEMIRYTYEHGGQDFLIDGIIRRAAEYNIYGFEHDGYVAHVDSTAAYYKANMDILQPEVWEELFMGQHPVYTKVKDEVPVQYKETAKVKNSLIANGCIVRGEVENSILFRGVKVAEGVKIKNSIIMQKCDIQEGSLLENVICDKNVIISKEKWLKGAANYPLIVTKNVVI
ncbi:MAG: glucose-1-phosphate adenylyltransferase subunit GlgD [Selenomonas sp.]|uniref:glucose-1-phosphate adenylyltransferase subunit GlgD n=1 Tax=Selenomonas sp. TaxID=2053611 RepID=UPI0025F0CD48|nr:glucose-1-phosphate adenylyltransferase subunit GlgD [Selenomonas sp.]MCR5438651.1 glucose-1-phosphate adenylyltransferase subunit GlgD [Selenomonas sp.]